jgi:hypothetical protein
MKKYLIYGILIFISLISCRALTDFKPVNELYFDILLWSIGLTNFGLCVANIIIHEDRSAHDI